MVCPVLGPRSMIRSMPPPPPSPWLRPLDLLYMVLVVTVTDPSVELGEHFQAACTGTLVTHTVVLTSANCVHVDAYDDFPDPTGTVVYQRPNQTFKAVKISLHPWSKTGDVDLALIWMAGETSLGDVFPRFAYGPMTFSNRDLERCVLAGYGGRGRPSQKTFHVVDLNKTKSEFVPCRRPLVQRVCIRFEDIIPCGGDVGSALICGGDTVVAVYTPLRDPGSYPRNCVDRAGAVFSPMWPVTPWLQAVLEAPGAGLEWVNNPWSLLLVSLSVLGVTGLLYCALVQLLHYRFHKRSVEEALAEPVQEDSPPEPTPSVTTKPGTSRTSITSTTGWGKFWR